MTSLIWEQWKQSKVIIKRGLQPQHLIAADADEDKESPRSAPAAERTQVDPLEPPKGGASAEPKQERRNPISVRYSDVEIQTLRAEAREAGYSFRGYIRAKSLGKAYKPPLHAELKEVLLKVFTELTRQGNNLNQIAKHLNSGTATRPEGESMVAMLSRSLMSAYRAVSKTLANGMPEP